MKKIAGLLLIGCLCQATCKKTADPCIGPKINDCICTAEYRPVCGCNEKTYGNPCMAHCDGVKTWTEGECE